MDVKIKPGNYVVAVSGGVDSTVLLDLLAKRPDMKLTVAHFDHGIRPDSAEDRKFVQAAAKKYGLPFVFEEGKLGAKASESVARGARYKYLRKVADAEGAHAIITAHHQDDLLETAVINMLRGTGRKGLTSLQSQANLLRPLLPFSKAVIIDYAKSHRLKWCEDVTNQDTSYLRNYVRHNILPRFTDQQRRQLLKHIDDLKLLNSDIDNLLAELVDRQLELDRQMFICLDHTVAREVMAGWLKNQGVTDLDSKRLELLVKAAKTFANNKRFDIDKTHFLRVEKKKLKLLGLQNWHSGV